MGAVATPGKPRWTDFASLGYLMAALAPTLFLLAGLVFGLSIGDEIAFFAVAIAVPLLGLFLVRKFASLWSRIAGIILGLGSIMFLFWTAFGLAYPASFFDFVPGLLVIPGAFIAIGSNIASIVAKRRGHFSASAEGGERSAIRIVVAVLALLAVLSGLLNIVGRKTADENAASATVVAKNFEYAKSQYDVTGGTKILLKNSDPFFHTFTVKDLGIDVSLLPGSSKLVDVPAKPGTYVAYCKPHSDSENPSTDPSSDDMATKLVVS